MNRQDRIFYILLAIAVLANLSALDITILAPDGALYATIAKTMVVQNNYVDLFVEGRDWLDKPHFPFWMAALSFEVFGFTSFAYKLPAILFLLLGAYYTYRLALDQYGKTVAQWAVIILLTAQHIMISNNDVRAEPYLTGLIVASLFHFSRSIGKASFIHLLMGSAFAGCAVMTKGIFALVPIFFGIAGQLVFTGRWKELFKPKWFIAILLTFIFILPELYCLYVQFDMHPEKTVFGRQGVSGIRFFFWDSQFGRFMNTGPIKGKGDPTFFLHTTLWAFLPWSIMLYAAIWQFFRKKNRVVQREWLNICAALSTFLLFSASKFQLPHYINIVFPFFSILTANYIVNLQTSRGFRFFSITQYVLAGIYIVAMLALIILFRPENLTLSIILVALLPIFLIWIPKLLRVNPKEKVLVVAVVSAVFLNLFINRSMYPSMMKYQSGSEAARYINLQHPGIPVVQLRKYISYPLEFYLDAPVVYLDSLEQFNMLSRRPFLVFVPENEVAGWTQDQPRKEFPHFPISRLTGDFINHKTRNSAAEDYHLYVYE